MDLYSYVSIESFVRGCKESKTPGTFTLHVPNLLYAKSDEVIGYGLSLLRRSIVLHEEQKGIGPELSKQNIPFFRENRRMLIGPEIEMYALSLYQNPEIPSGVEAQAEQAFANLTELLKAAGTSTKKTVKTTVFIKNMDDFGKINEVYAKHFKEPYPARSCVQIARLPKDVAIEIEAVAVKN